MENKCKKKLLDEPGHQNVEGNHSDVVHFVEGESVWQERWNILPEEIGSACMLKKR